VGKRKTEATKGSPFEKLVRAVVSLPKDEVERLKKADQQRERRKWTKRQPAS